VRRVFGAFIDVAGESLADWGGTTDCLYCPVEQTNHLLEQLGIETMHVWWNAGYMAVYIIFNTLAIYAIYWFARVPKGKKGKQS
jgi:ATP-binding cassette, subfamily G (WHITE), member 2, PDR